MAELPPGWKSVEPMDSVTTGGLPPGFQVLPEPPGPSVVQDVVQSTPSMLGLGGLGVFGMAGDLSNAAMYASDWIKSQFTGKPMRSPEDRAASRLMPTTGELAADYERRTGTQFHYPQTRLGQDIGAGEELIPGALTFGGGAPWKRMGEKVVKYALGPGAGGQEAGRAVEAAGGSDTMANIAKGVVTTAIGAGAAMHAPRDLTPSTEALAAKGSQLFENAKASGLVVKGAALRRLAVDQAAAARNLGFSRMDEVAKELTPKTRAALTAMEDAAYNYGSQPLQEIHNLRQLINSAITGAAPGSTDMKMAITLRDRFDNFLENMKQRDVASGDRRGATVLREAIGIWKRMSKSEVIDDLYRTAKLNEKPGTLSFEQALRNQFRTLAKSDQMNRFSYPERAAIRAVVSGGPVDKALTALGTFAPQAGLTGFGRAGAGVALGMEAANQFGGNPWLGLAVPVVGSFARGASEAMIRGNAARAGQLVRGGAGSVPPQPLMWPLSAYYMTRNMATTPPPGSQ